MVTEAAHRPRDGEVVAACALAAVPGLGAAALSRIASAFGSFEAALVAGAAVIRSRSSELRLRADTIRYLEEDPDLLRLGEWAVAEARRVGARPLLLGRDDYPELIASSSRPPCVLYVRGELASVAKRVAIVGARDSDDEGLAAARSLAGDLARAGVEVVSGGARGIDAAAHAGALWESGRTIAVLGCGIDQAYPPENREIFDRMAASGGAVVSELVPGTQPLRKNFPRRNRVIAAFSHATVVVRARLGSGALITARDALAEGRKVFVVRGPRGNDLSEGPEALLQEGSVRPVSDGGDLLAQLGWDRGPEARVATERDGADDRPLAPDEASERLLGLLDDRTPVHVDDLVTRSHLAPQEVLRRLTDLEILGLCKQRPGRYFLRR